jgi:hypothetical protein
MACFSSPSLLDAYTLDLLGEENRALYGQYRLWYVAVVTRVAD